MAIPNDDRDSVNKAIEGDNNTLSCKYGEKKMKHGIQYNNQ